MGPGQARRARVPESASLVARPPRSDGGWTRDDDGSSERVRGFGSTRAAEGAVRVLDPRWSRLPGWPTAGGLPPPGDLQPWGQGAPTGPGLIIRDLVQTICMQTNFRPVQFFCTPERSRSWDPYFKFCKKEESCKFLFAHILSNDALHLGFCPENWFGWFAWFGSGLDTFAPQCTQCASKHGTGARLLLPVSPAATGNETPDSGSDPLSRSPYLNVISKSPASSASCSVSNT